MKKILWFSRHDMTDAQKTDLERIYGKIKTVKTTGTANSWKDITCAGADCDILAVVLPPNILMDLVNPRNNTKPVIRAVAGRVPTGNMVKNPATGTDEAEYVFIHKGWEQIKKFDMVVEQL